MRLWLAWSRNPTNEQLTAGGPDIGRRPPVRRVVEVEPDLTLAKRLPLSRKAPVVSALLGADNVADPDHVDLDDGDADNVEAVDVPGTSPVRADAAGHPVTCATLWWVSTGAGMSLHPYSGTLTSVSAAAEALTARKLHPRRALTMRYKSQGEVWRTLANDGAASGRSFLHRLAEDSAAVQAGAPEIARTFTQHTLHPHSVTSSQGGSVASTPGAVLSLPSSTPGGRSERRHGTPGVLRALARTLQTSALSRSDTGTLTVGEPHQFTDLYVTPPVFQRARAWMLTQTT